jgi:hypothetical protein
MCGLQAYEDSCTLWASLVLHLDSDKLPKQFRTLFWGTHQRFFKSLFVAAKVEGLICSRVPFAFKTVPVI